MKFEFKFRIWRRSNWLSSFVVYSKYHSSAEKWSVTVCKACVIIICVIPQTFGSHANTLTCHLTYNCLNYNFVWRYIKQFHLSLDLLNDVFNLRLWLRLVILFTLKMLLYNFLDNISDFRWIKPNFISFYLRTYPVLLVQVSKCSRMLVSLQIGPFIF